MVKKEKRKHIMRCKSVLYVVLAGLFWGSSGLFVAALAPYGVGSAQLTAVRALVSLLFMTLFLFLYDKRLFRVALRELPLLLGVGCGLYFTGFCYFSSMQMTSVSTAVMLMYTAPVLVAVYSFLFLGEKMTPFKGVSIIIVMLGCVLVSGVIGGFSYNAAGILIGLGAGVAYSAYNIFTKYEMRRGSHPLTVTFYAYVVMTLLSLPTADLGGTLSVVSETPATLLLMIGMGACTTIIPYLLYTFGMRVLPAGTTASLAVVEPVAATLYSVLFLSESLRWDSLCGVLLVVFAVLLLGRTETKKEK